MQTNISVIETVDQGTLFVKWENLGFPPLSVALRFSGMNYEDNIILKPPFGSGNSRRIELLLREIKRMSDTHRVRAFDLLLTRRYSDEIIGRVARLEGGIINAVSLLGWGLKFPAHHDESIKARLKVNSNDYSLFEMAAKALGVNDIVNGECPEIAKYPRFTVIIPAYNVQRTISKVVEAVVEATENLRYSQWECIIVDDANEVPLSMIDSYHSSIRILRSDRKLYCGGSRNAGITNSNANSSIIFFCDGDTIIAPNYFREHLFRQLIAPNIITVSLRENIDAQIPTPNRMPDIASDTRIHAVYKPGRIGSVPVNEQIEVRAIEDTREFREFGFWRHLGPADLPFMVKGNNLCVSKDIAQIGFPPGFIGYGPEDVTFAAKAIARGCMVIPVLSTGVFHVNHEIRSGSNYLKNKELVDNIKRQQTQLNGLAWKDWISNYDME